jgi:hypothetical protein
LPGSECPVFSPEFLREKFRSWHAGRRGKRRTCRKIEDAESAARKAYAEHVDRETRGDPDNRVVGSIYGGIICNFTKGKVSHIFFGAGAE